MCVPLFHEQYGNSLLCLLTDFEVRKNPYIWSSLYSWNQKHVFNITSWEFTGTVSKAPEDAFYFPSWHWHLVASYVMWAKATLTLFWVAGSLVSPAWAVCLDLRTLHFLHKLCILSRALWLYATAFSLEGTLFVMCFFAQFLQYSNIS